MHGRKFDLTFSTCWHNQYQMELCLLNLECCRAVVIFVQCKGTCLHFLSRRKIILSTPSYKLYKIFEFGYCATKSIVSMVELSLVFHRPLSSVTIGTLNLWVPCAIVTIPIYSLKYLEVLGCTLRRPNVIEIFR